ncbi:MAG TPA: LysR substrate-binding domain-containing protein [Solirubrobacteraceae bacterium]|nr:LysR substrate-binding domain-containing protein [Solirubrobacteraceae bacterium]
MELRHLRYFEAVARHRHFTRAADELHVAQSALSHQVRRLEQELGIELLDRTTRTVEPTQAGTMVAARARVILEHAAALREEVDELRGLVRGRVTIGALLFGGELDIPALLAAFTGAYPDVEVGLREGTVQRMVDGLLDGTIDVAFILESEQRDAFERIELSSEELVVVMSPGHALVGKRPISVRSLAGERLIGFEHGSSVRQLVDGAFARAGVQPTIALEGNDLALVRSLVAQGIGLAILPRTFAELPGPPVVVRPLGPSLRMAVALWWRRGRHLSPAARAFVEFARERASATPRAPRPRGRPAESRQPQATAPAPAASAPPRRRRA